MQGENFPRKMAKKASIKMFLVFIGLLQEIRTGRVFQTVHHLRAKSLRRLQRLLFEYQRTRGEHAIFVYVLRGIGA